jgi:beta-glucosidase
MQFRFRQKDYHPSRLLRGFQMFLLVLIIIGCGLLVTRGSWVPVLVDYILQDEVQSVPIEPPVNALYRSSEYPVEVRVNDLLSYMTLEEKVGQMALVEKNSVHDISDISRYSIGALLSGFGGKPENNTPEGWDTMVLNFIHESEKNRLGIPMFYGADAIHGHSNVPGATIFPHSIGLGATRDAVLVENIARATAEELRATNIRWSFSPTLDMPNDIRWGRTYETFSDDSEVVTLLSTAYLRGLQKKSTLGTSTLFVMGTAKHFIGLGGMMWGTASNKNFTIDQGTTKPDEQQLRTAYLPSFKALIDAGVLSVMVGLNSWGETKLSADSYLITEVLKDELGFKGFTVSDWYAVYEMSGNEYDNAVTAINAGIDMVMLPFDYKTFIQNVTEAVRRGEISEDRIDDAVRRILRAKFALGLFDTSVQEGAYEVVGSASHRALARDAVAQSLVLLKNEESVLPLKKSIKHIRVAGSAADNIGKQTGAWTVEWQGIDGNWLPGATSILEGIRTRAGNGVQIEYTEDGDFGTSTTRADIGIAVVGEKPYAEGWGDKAYPVLDTYDLEAIKKLQATCNTVVVIIISGRPLLVTNEIASWNAVVAGWLPGSEGQGVADVLFGDKPFTGKLPLPWPLHSEQLPITKEGVTKDGTAVLFPRGYGLR